MRQGNRFKSTSGAFLGRGTGPALALAVWLSGCTTPDPQNLAARRFSESDRADLVVQFYSWEYFHIVRPDYRHEGFLVPVSRNRLTEHLQRLRVQRQMAVVVLGVNDSAEEKARLIAEWETLLFNHGFHRVVCLQGNGGKKIDGLLVLADTGLTPREARAEWKAGGSL